jgi:hypothetical protein
LLCNRLHHYACSSKLSNNRAAAAAAALAAPVLLLLLLLNQLPLLLSLQLLTGPQRGCRSSGWRAQQWA